MNRRTVIKNLALVLGGAVLLPACVNKNGEIFVQLKHIQLNEDQQNLIAEISETIIPKTNTPGAKELNLPAFILKMFDDSYNKKDQLAILNGIQDFALSANKKFNKAFADLSQKEKEAFLLGLEAESKAFQEKNKTQPGKVPAQKETEAPALYTFYWAIKQQTIFAYTTSQYFMTKQIVYELIPGRYNAHFSVKNIKTA